MQIKTEEIPIDDTSKVGEIIKKSCDEKWVLGYRLVTAVVLTDKPDKKVVLIFHKQD